MNDQAESIKTPTLEHPMTRDNTLVSIVAQGNLEPHNQTSVPKGWLQISGSLRLYKSFTPTRTLLTEIVTATYAGEGLPDSHLQEVVPNAPDLVLVKAFSVPTPFPEKICPGEAVF